MDRPRGKFEQQDSSFAGGFCQSKNTPSNRTYATANRCPRQDTEKKPMLDAQRELSAFTGLSQEKRLMDDVSAL